jgi:C4-dicarboxylate-specific signal transduction histidine kinase
MTSGRRPADDDGISAAIDIPRLVGRASRSVTHRLVNDLAALRLQAEAASRTTDPEAMAARLSGVTEGAAVAVALVRELHRLGDAATGPRPFDLRQFAVELAPLLTALAGTRGDVVVDTPPGPVVCEADPADLRRHLVAALLDRPSDSPSSSDRSESLSLDVAAAAGASVVLRDGEAIVFAWANGD